MNHFDEEDEMIRGGKALGFGLLYTIATLLIVGAAFLYHFFV